MSNERKDEFLSWRGRLDSPEGVPGQGLGHPEQTWQRLMDRLRERPRRRLPVYGIVAACLLLAIIPASRLFRNWDPSFRPARTRQTTPLVSRPDGGMKIFLSPLRTASPAPAGTLAAQRGRRPEAGTYGGPFVTAPKRTGGSRPGSPPFGGMAMRTVAVTSDTVYIPRAPAIPLVSQSPVAGPVPQNKWKVVDLNELNSSWQPPHSMADNFLPWSLRFGPGRREPVPAAGSAVSPDKPPLRIKFSP